MKFKICAITLTMILAGCGSSSLVTPTGRGGDLSFDAFNKRVENDEVTVVFRDGLRAIGKGFRIEGDSASWAEAERGSLFKVPVTKIRAITTNPDRFRGGLIGFGAGAATGGLAGWALGSGVASTAEHGTWAEAAAIAGAGLGALIGTPIGVAAAPSTEYHFGEIE